MNRIIAVVALALCSIAVSATSSAQSESSALRDYQVPDFAGRDKAYSYLRSKILEGMREGANFNGHYTVVRIGCGSGCSNNLLVNRKTGQIYSIPFGGEQQQMLTFRHSVRSDMLTAIWTDFDDCFSQDARWNGGGFEVSSAPRMVPEALCAS